MNVFENLFNNKKLQLVIIVTFTFLVYSNIFANDFAADDIDYVFNWDLPKHVENIGKILTSESVPPSDRGVYRPVKSLFIMASYHLWGFKVFGYHLQAILIHLSATVLVYLIVETLISADLKRRLALMPFIAALLFGLHPIHTEAVTFITASFDSLGLVFYLAAFWLYLKTRISADGKRIMQIGSVVFAGLAFFTYEMTITLPIMLIITDWVLISAEKKKSVVGGQLSIISYTPYFLLLGFYLVVRFFVLDVGTREDYLGDSFYKTQLVMTFAWVKYLWLLIWPLDLSADHKLLPGIYSVVYQAYVSTETLNSLFVVWPRVVLNLGILTGLGVVGVYFWRKLSVISFAIFWFFITLLPVAFILPQSSVMAERYVYLASFGYALISADLILIIADRIGKKGQRGTVYRGYRVFPLLALGIIVLWYGYLTFQRNFDYKDTQTFWEKLAVQSPDNVITNYTLAKIYAEKQQYDLALDYFNRALALVPGIVEIHFRMGQIYASLGQIDSALASYQMALGTPNRYSNFAQMEIGKIERKKNAGPASNIWRDYSLGDIQFSYPGWWTLTKLDNAVVLDDFESSRSFEIETHEILASIEDYLAEDDNFGMLASQGTVNLPNVRSGYFKLYELERLRTLVIFLFEGGKFVKMTVYPAVDSSGDFDRMLKSIKIPD